MTKIGQHRRKGEKTEEKNELARAELIFIRHKSDLQSESWRQYPNPQTRTYTTEESRHPRALLQPLRNDKVSESMTRTHD